MLLVYIILLEGFAVERAGDCKTGLKKLEHYAADVVLCDVKLPDGNGVDMAQTIKNKYPLTEIILLTAYGNIPDGVQAIKNGAFDYITKGEDNNKILPLLHRALEKVALTKRVKQLEKQLGHQYSFDRIIGTSPAIKTAITLAQKVAPTDTSVLLTGETGSGKEVFAQAIHQASMRQAGHFVAINCAAFSKDLLENEMFGHRAGAFTGANKDQKGLFEEAHQGTIFLDEIGEMALDLQAKLLRIIETGTFLKIGDTKPTKVDVRIVAATHRDLLQEVKNGHFREDLYYRISVLRVHYADNLPPAQADAEKTAWVLTNLIANAIHYSHDNTPIEIEVRPSGQHVLFTIKDAGQGIAPQYKDKIFDRYFRVPGSKKDGTGLGLSISKEFIEAQGGTIHVDSELGAGSTFTVALNRAGE